MKASKLLISIILSMIFCEAHISLAAVSEDASPETIISTVAAERHRSAQKYWAEKQKQELATATAIPPPVSSPVAQKKEYSNNRHKNDIILGVILVAVTIALSFRLHRLSKNKKN